MTVRRGSTLVLKNSCPNQSWFICSTGCPHLSPGDFQGFTRNAGISGEHWRRWRSLWDTWDVTGRWKRYVCSNDWLYWRKAGTLSTETGGDVWTTEEFCRRAANSYKGICQGWTLNAKGRYQYGYQLHEISQRASMLLWKLKHVARNCWPYYFSLRKRVFIKMSQKWNFCQWPIALYQTNQSEFYS